MKITLDWLNSQPHESAGNGREVRYNCPNCDDTGKHLYVNLDNLWYCFKCGRGGKVLANQITEPSIENFRVHIENKVNPEMSVNRIVKSLPLHRAIHASPDDYKYREEFPLTAVTYLFERGITKDELITHDISISLEKNGPYRNSIIFPVYSMFPQRHTLEYFVCRKYDGTKPKYTNAPWPKDNTLFIADANRGGPNYPWVICEGIFDALAVCRVGYNALALLGKTPTSQQLKRLAEKDRYLIYLDDDAFSNAINLKLQLGALGTKSQLVVHKIDAAKLYLDDTPLLRSLLDGATKQLNEYKKQPL
jgi:hypothetical protein